MDVGELLALLRRRWAVLVPMLAVTVIAVAGAFAKIPTQYESQVQLTMLNAQKVTNQPGNDGNPFLAFDSTLGVDVDFLARNVTSGSSAQQLAALGVTETYSAAIADNALGPFMQLSVTGPDEHHVTLSLRTLVNFTEQRWLSLQKASDAPANSIIGMDEIAPPSAPSPVYKRKIEAVAGVAAIGIVLSILIPVVVDTIIRRRKGRYRPPEPARVEPIAAEPPTAEPSRAEPSRAEPFWAEAPRTEQRKAEAPKTEPFRIQPAGEEPVQRRSPIA
jgi:hypothetical protein